MENQHEMPRGKKLINRNGNRNKWKRSNHTLKMKLAHIFTPFQFIVTYLLMIFSKESGGNCNLAKGDETCALEISPYSPTTTVSLEKKHVKLWMVPKGLLKCA